jgi:hypothetical protein
VGGVTWEGSRVTFKEEQLDEKPDIKPTVGELAAADEVEDVKPSKEERKRAKEERRRLKEEKRARKAAKLEVKEETGILSEPVVAAKKEKRKRDNGTEGPAGKRDKTHM